MYVQRINKCYIVNAIKQFILVVFIELTFENYFSMAEIVFYLIGNWKF